MTGKNGSQTNGAQRAPANVYEAIIEIRRRVPYFQKEKVPDLKYKVTQIETVLRELIPHMNELGLLLIPCGEAKLIHDEMYESNRGGKMRRVVISTAYKFHHAPSNTSTEEPIPALGEASDSGDKAIPKAHTAAYKVALRQGIGYETGETDPDVHPGVAAAGGRAIDTATTLSAKRALAQADDLERLEYVWNHIEKLHGKGSITDEQIAALRVTRDKREQDISPVSAR